jgi:hypothetical protein
MGIIIGVIILMGIGVIVVVMNLSMKKKGYDIPGRSIVRCSQGHYFRTLWIAGASLNAIRLTPTKRAQRCPVCHKFRIIVPIAEAEQTDAIRAEAQRNSPQ